MAQFSAYERQSNHTNDRTIAVRNIIRDVDAQRLRRIGGYNGANSALGCSGSTFWRRWFLYLGPPYHYYGGGLSVIVVIVLVVLLLRG